MNTTNQANAVNINIGSLGLFTQTTLADLLSSSEVTTSCLGGRIVHLGTESFFISDLARNILNQNSSPAVCMALEKLFIRSDKDVASKSLLIRVAASFRDAVMGFCTLNAAIMKKAMAAKAKAITLKTQRSISPTLEMTIAPTPQKPERPIMRKNFSCYTAVEAEPEQMAKEIEEDTSLQEELSLLTREKTQAEKKITWLDQEILKQEDTFYKTILALQEVLSKQNPTSPHAIELLKEVSLQSKLAATQKSDLQKQIAETIAFLKETTESLAKLKA